MQSFLDSFSLWAFMAIVLALIVLAVEAGYQVGKRMKIEKELSSIGSIVGSTLGLLAFMLAFTFGFAANRFETRRELVIKESNAIGTTYLRSSYLEEPYKSDIQALLKEYVDLRLLNPSIKEISSVIEKSDVIQNRLWSITTTLAQKHPDSDVLGLFIQSLNNVIDLHSERVMAVLWARVPVTIWIALLFLTVLAMFSIGFMSGLSQARSFLVLTTLVFGFLSVFFLIADLDRSREGFLHVPQASMIDLQKKISS